MVTGVREAADAGERELAESIRSAGLKLTAPRLAVMRALADAPHADAEHLFAVVRAELAGTSLQAVYGVLTALTGAGLVRRVQPAGSPARFERRVGDNHHHAVCTRCNSMHDIECVVGEAPCLTPADSAGIGGFVVQSAEVTFWGLCESCQQEPA
jgi:Fe2+ or Zn2+ uptake regulation protein